jgi:hypothetical protein
MNSVISFTKAKTSDFYNAVFLSTPSFVVYLKTRQHETFDQLG